MKIANLENNISTYIEKVYLRRSVMDKEQIIDYVMNSPANTNRAVLEGMLDEIGGGGTSEPLIVNFSVQNGFEVLDKTWTEISEAIMLGRNVYLNYPDSEQPIRLYALLEFRNEDTVMFSTYTYYKNGTFDPYPAYDPG